MVALGQTVTVVNKSGKVVSTSKHLVNIFKEAKSAYGERKAELAVNRKKEHDIQVEEHKARKRLESLELGDDDASSRRSSRRGSEDGRSRRGSDDGRSVKRKPTRKERPPVERGVSDSFYANDLPRHERHVSHRSSPLRESSSPLPGNDPRVGELTRRHTDSVSRRRSHPRPSTANRSSSLDAVDMDLAYGDIPPPLPESKHENEVELRDKMTALQRLLEEANCVQHSATAMIDNLQQNPDAMAAVALTLAEISNIAAKMAPGALMSMKGAFPAIVALLASPQFAIAAGVGVGVTIIAFGSYKIVKKMQANKEAKALEAAGQQPAIADEAAADSPTGADGQEDLRELNGIERWRRGIADVEATSAGTSVDGEFITNQAARTLIDEGRLTEADFKKGGSDAGKSERRRKKDAKSAAKSEAKSSKSRAKSEAKSEAKSRSGGSSKGGEKREKRKEPSGLRMLFKTA